jgi:hypothetical protein
MRWATLLYHKVLPRYGPRQRAQPIWTETATKINLFSLQVDYLRYLLQWWKADWYNVLPGYPVAMCAQPGPQNPCNLSALDWLSYHLPMIFFSQSSTPPLFAYLHTWPPAQTLHVPVPLFCPQDPAPVCQFPVAPCILKGGFCLPRNWKPSPLQPASELLWRLVDHSYAFRVRSNSSLGKKPLWRLFLWVHFFSSMTL